MPRTLIAKNDADPVLCDVVQFNAVEFNYRIVRWSELPVTVNDAVGLECLDDAISDWNHALGFTALIWGGNDSSIHIVEDRTCTAHTKIVQSEGWALKKVQISLNTERTGYPLPERWDDHFRCSVKHELGHALGFWGHLDENGVMSSAPEWAISAREATVIKRLYTLEPGTRVRPPLWIILANRLDEARRERRIRQWVNVIKGVASK